MIGHRTIRILLALAMMSPVAFAKVPLPRAKPDLNAGAAGVSIPKPRPRPEPADQIFEPPIELPAAKQESDGNPVPLPKSSDQPVLQQFNTGSEAGPWPTGQTRAARLECAKLLAGLNLVWTPDTPLGEPGGCGTPAPIAVSEVAGIRLNPPVTVNCAMAAAMHQWLEQSVKPAAERDIGRKISEIRTASSYACRSRNNVAGAKLSEHGHANAIDIAAFIFGREAEVSVAGDWSGLFQAIGLSGRGNFLRTVRTESCTYFNTVLGPGSDAYHKDHFHVDLAPRRNRGKFCH